MSTCSCCDSTKQVLLDRDLVLLERDVAKLKKAIQDGLYGSRSIVGDAVIRMESSLARIREDFPNNVVIPNKG